jgi:hypothetical protein
MKIKTLLFVVIFGFLSLFNFANAEVVITEIMYDVEGSDSGREWIELYNNGESPVVIKGGSAGDDSWRIFQQSQSGTENNRTLSPDAYQGDMTINAGEYLVVTQDGVLFKGDWQSYTGNILVSSAMTLTNTSGTLGLRLGSGGVPWSLILYNSESGGNGDGKSLQLVGNAWLANTPTPGAANELGASSSGGSQGGASANPPKPVVKKKIKIEITARELAFVGIPVNFKAETYDVTEEPVSYGKYFWNFGDGDFRESNVSYFQEKFTHRYSYPGEYKVSLEYHKNYYSEVPDAVAEILIKVIASDVIISGVGTEKDFFVEVTNNTGYDGDVSRWYLRSGEKNYVFPKNTTIGAKKSMRLSPRITGFNFSDRNNLELRNSEWDLVHEYGVALPKEEKPVLISLSNVETPKSLSVSKENKEEVALMTERIEAEEETSVLPASVISSDVSEEVTNSHLPVTIFSVLMLGSAGAVYFIRQKQEE